MNNIKKSSKIKQLNINDLIPYVNNSKRHSEDQIKKVMASIKEFGFINPVIIDSGKGIIAGHCRVIAATRLGIKTIPTIEVSHLSEAQKKAYILADNRLAELAVWDQDLLNVEFDFLKENNIDIDALGFDADFFEIEQEEHDVDFEDLDEIEKSNKKQTEGKKCETIAGYSADTHLRIIIYVKDAQTIEKAIQKTGEQARGEAILKICKYYLGHKE